MELDWIDKLCEAFKEVIYSFKVMDKDPKYIIGVDSYDEHNIQHDNIMKQNMDGTYECLNSRVITKEDFEAAVKRLEDAHIDYKALPNVDDIKDIYVNI